MKNILNKKLIKSIIILLAIMLWVRWDLYQAGNNISGQPYKSFYPAASKADSVSAAVVSLVRADDKDLANPALMTSDPTSQTIEQMVRKAVTLMGGFNRKIKTGMTVLIKPNLVEPQPNGNGTLTDVRVVEAVCRIVDEIDHGKIKIVVGDGSPRPFTTFEKANSSGKTPWTQLFDKPGYPELKTRMLALGIDFRITNLNGNSDTEPLSELREVTVPGGGEAQPQKGVYRIHKDVLDADVYITIPVMKIHDPGLTCALKNQIGIAPSSLYGFSKFSGTPQDNYKHKLSHNTTEPPYMWTDKEIVDLCTIAKIKFVVVDALMCLDISKTVKADKSNQVRMNCILAGEDPVAVDHVCCRLMGLNPDDVEHITLAERKGLGTNDDSKITVSGAAIENTKKLFRKNYSVQDQLFGQGNRYWLLNGTYFTTGINNPMDYEFIPNEASILPTAGKDGWSSETYFINDRINLKDYYKALSINTDNVVSYAACYFYAPADQEAELWIGSDEALKVYINGSVAYNFTGTRTLAAASVLSETVKINIKKGMNRLLVKSLQKISNSFYDFSLNICDVQTNQYFAGNRVWGLKFYTNPNLLSIKEPLANTPENFILNQNYPNPFNPVTKINYYLPLESSVHISVYDLSGRLVKNLLSGNQVPGVHEVEFNASGFSSGVYFYTIKVKSQNGKLNFTNTKKMVLIK